VDGNAEVQPGSDGKGIGMKDEHDWVKVHWTGFEICSHCGSGCFPGERAGMAECDVAKILADTHDWKADKENNRWVCKRCKWQCHYVRYHPYASETCNKLVMEEALG
jgi:hypothetical protein